MTIADHNFKLLLANIDVEDDDTFDALVEAGCDDALFGVIDGVPFAEFDREAPTFTGAVASAVQDIITAVPGASIVRIEPDSFVSLVTIGERLGLSREVVRLYAKGGRGPGGFPAPIHYVDAKTRLWHWPSVLEWFRHHRPETLKKVGGFEVSYRNAEVVEMVNGALRARDAAINLHVDEEELRLVTEIVEAGASPQPSFQMFVGRAHEALTTLH